jgi:hypothetical protein
MAIDTATFGIGETPEEQTQQPTPRRRPRKLGGLAALAAGVGTGQSDDGLSKDPIGEGDVSSPIATPGLSGKPGEPSLLATERVQRAPATFSAQPLLGAEDRAGAAFGEADRGEEGTLGGGTRQGLSTSSRNKALMSFFKPAARSAQPAQLTQATPSQDGSLDAAKAVGAANKAVGAAGRLRKLFTQADPPFELSGMTSLAATNPDPSGWSLKDMLADPDKLLYAVGRGPNEGLGARELGDVNASAHENLDAPTLSTPDFSKASTYGTGLGLLGSGLGLAGTATQNRDLALAGGAASAAGQGVNLGRNIASGATGVGANVASGAGLVGAGLGLAGSLTGERDLSLAGNSLSTLASLYGLGSGLYGAAGASLAPTLAATVPEALSLLGSGTGAVVGGGTGALAGGATGAAAGTATGAAAGSGAGATAGLGLGATAGLAGGVLALPGIVQMALDYFAPDWVGPSHYGKTRTKEDFKGQSSIAKMGALSNLVEQNPQLLRAALNYDAGPVKTSFNGRAWADMAPEEFDAALASIKQDPNLLNSVTGDANAIPYIDDTNRSYFANEAADYTRNMIAKQLGLEYGFVPREHRARDYHGYTPDNDARLTDLYEMDREGTPTGRLNPRADWAGVEDALNTATQRGVDVSTLPSMDQVRAMQAQPNGLQALFNGGVDEEFVNAMQQRMNF